MYKGSREKREPFLELAFHAKDSVCMKLLHNGKMEAETI